MKNNLGIALEKSTIISDLKLKNGEYNLLTLHRITMLMDIFLEVILNQLGETSENYFAGLILEHAEKMLADSFAACAYPNDYVPLAYLDRHWAALGNAAKRIITDSWSGPKKKCQPI